MVCSSHSLPKQMFALNKIFTAVSSTAFVHKHRYNQDKMKGLGEALTRKQNKQTNKKTRNILLYSLLSHGRNLPNVSKPKCKMLHLWNAFWRVESSTNSSLTWHHRAFPTEIEVSHSSVLFNSCWKIVSQKKILELLLVFIYGLWVKLQEPHGK